MSVDDRVPVVADDTAGAILRGRDARSSTALVVAWQDPDSRLIAPVGILECEADLGYRFHYVRNAAELPRFQPFMSFPDLGRSYVSETLFPLFSERIMSPRRPDFPRFLHQLHLDEHSSPWEQLARSEGRRTGDTVQVFPVPTVQENGASACLFLVHGIRHVISGDLPPLRPGDRLALCDAPDNPVNPAAVLVCGPDGQALGYVPDLLLEYLDALRSTGPVAVTVEHVNGPDAPLHLRLLVRLEGRAPSGYQPMSGDRWRPYVS